MHNWQQKGLLHILLYKLNFVSIYLCIPKNNCSGALQLSHILVTKLYCLKFHIILFKVQPSDTLEGIAIRYDITPSELAVLNKLSSRTVFPGQVNWISTFFLFLKFLKCHINFSRMITLLLVWWSCNFEVH